MSRTIINALGMLSWLWPVARKVDVPARVVAEKPFAPPQVIRLNRVLSIGVFGGDQYETILSDTLSREEILFHGSPGCRRLGKAVGVKILLGNSELLEGSGQLEHGEQRKGILKIQLSPHDESRLEEFLIKNRR